MSDAHWSAGYYTAQTYTTGYFAELNPHRMDTALLVAGYEPTPAGPYCELGFGQGVSIAVHAAANPTRQWWGTDFIPEHARHARDLVQRADSTATLLDMSFEELATRSDLPQFAVVALHGVWSWISDENRRTVAEFVRRHLMPGGVLYLSYNTLPGWSSSLLLRELMSVHARLDARSSAPTTEKVNGGLALADKLAELKASAITTDPGWTARLDALRKQRPEYLAHEYLNKDWHPQFFSQVSEVLDAAKLSFATSALPQEGFLPLYFSDEQRAFLSKVQNTTLYETYADAMLNRMFRRDLWVKGPVRLPPAEAAERLGRHTLLLTLPPEQVQTRVKGPRGEADLNRLGLEKLLNFMGPLSEPVTHSQVLSQMGRDGVDPNKARDLLRLLLGNGTLQTVQPPATVAAAAPRTKALNRHLITRSAGERSIDWLASPITGGAIGVPAITQTLLGAYVEGHRQPLACARNAVARLAENGRQVVRDGAPITNLDEAASHLEPQARKVFDNVLPTMRRVGILTES